MSVAPCFGHLIIPGVAIQMTNIVNVKIRLQFPAVQYFAGLLVSLVFLLVLMNSKAAYTNLQVPEGEYQHNRWAGTDVMSYVNPARNYLQYGVFGEGNTPDYVRGIGYPLFLSVMMKVFGSKWLVATFLFQAVIFAFAYPILTKIAAILFNQKYPYVIPAFLFYLVSGAYFTKVPILLTDTFFSVFFIIGLYFGLLSIVKQSWKYLFLQLFFIGYTAQVRPYLIFYPVLNVFILLSVARRYHISDSRKVKILISTSSILFLVLCNMQSFRNYLNYGFFAPSDVSSTILFTCLAKPVLVNVNEADSAEKMQAEIDKIDNIQKRSSLKRRYAINTFIEYPLPTLKQVAKNAVSSLGAAHHYDIFRFWGYHWCDTNIPGKMPFKKSSLVYAVRIIFYLVYFVIYLFFGFFLVRLIREKKIFFFFTILIFLFSFLFSAFIAGGAARMRLPVEGIIIIFSFYEISRIKYLKGTWLSSKTICQ